MTIGRNECVLREFIIKGADGGRVIDGFFIRRMQHQFPLLLLMWVSSFTRKQIIK